ncbi:hypothetical protein Dimus_020384 [Dionaea muscipula]
MHIAACKEFYANLNMYHYKKKEVARSRVRGVEIELDSMTLASILGVPSNNGISFNVPLIDKQGEEPKRYDFFEETFLTMCQLKRENGVWWIGTSEHRRRDDEAEEVNNEASAENMENEEVNEEERVRQEFDWEAVIDEVEIEREKVNQEAKIQGEHMEKEVEVEESGSGEKYFDAVDEERPNEVDTQAPDVPAPAPIGVQQKEKSAAGVDPSIPTGSIHDSVFMSLQAEFERARADRIQADLDKAQAENARLLALL